MTEVERRVDELVRQYSGRDFAEAVHRYSETLDPERQDELKRVLLARAADFDQAIMDRVDARGWFRRQWDRAGSSPPVNRQDR